MSRKKKAIEAITYGKFQLGKGRHPESNSA
jgi:hypothetical protein